MEPFAQYTNLSGGEDYTTISSIVPIIMELNLHLLEMRKKPNLSAVSLCLQEELQKRFDNLLSPKHTNFNPLYLAATALDPQFDLVISQEQKDAAKQYILQLLKEESEDVQNTPCDNESHTAEKTDSDSPPLKCFKHLSGLVTDKMNQLSQSSECLPIEKEVNSYFSRLQPSCSSVTKNDIADPIDFWITSEATYPMLSQLAFDILTIPTSSTSVERVFSTAGASCIGKRNRLTDSNLERKVFVKKNMNYITEM